MNDKKDLYWKLEKMQEDLQQLNRLDSEDLLTPEMEIYRNHIINWLSSLFEQIEENVDLYTSLIPFPNEEGYLSALEGEEGADLRLMKNLRNWEPKQPEVEEHPAEEVSSPVEQELPKKKKQKQKQKHQANVEEARLEGMAAGYYLLNELKNKDPMTEEDYFNLAYGEDEHEPPAIDSSYSFTDEDIILHEEIEDISLF